MLEPFAAALDRERVRNEAPEGSRVEAEVSGAAVWKVADPYPFAVFGVLGG